MRTLSNPSQELLEADRAWAKFFCNPWYTLLRVHDHVFNDERWCGERLAICELLRSLLLDIYMEQLEARKGLKVAK